MDGGETVEADPFPIPPVRPPGVEDMPPLGDVSLGWLEVEEQLKGQDLDLNRKHLLDTAKADAARRITELVRQAYCIVVTISEKNEVQAFKITVTDDPHFSTIKADKRARIQDSAITAEALLRV